MDKREDDKPEFTDEQLRAALKDVGEAARRQAFAAGRPIMIARNGRLLLLFADGRQKDVGPVETTQRGV